MVAHSNQSSYKETSNGLVSPHNGRNLHAFQTSRALFSRHHPYHTRCCYWSFIAYGHLSESSRRYVQDHLVKKRETRSLSQRNWSTLSHLSRGFRINAR